MALLSSARKLRRRGNKIITTKVEHPAVLETCKRLKEDGFEVVFLDVDVDGARVRIILCTADNSSVFKRIAVSVFRMRVELAHILLFIRLPEDIEGVVAENGDARFQRQCFVVAEDQIGSSADSKTTIYRHIPVNDIPSAVKRIRRPVCKQGVARTGFFRVYYRFVCVVPRAFNVLNAARSADFKGNDGASS